MSGSDSASPTNTDARPPSPYTSSRRRASSADFSDNSTATTCAPARAKLTVSVPMPHPISRTVRPCHRSNSAKPGMCGSTKYLRRSTSSKYSRVPTSRGEWRMLQGRRFQKSRTAPIDTPANGGLRTIGIHGFSPQRLQRVRRIIAARSAPVGDVAKARIVHDLGTEDSPQVDHDGRPIAGTEVGRCEAPELGVGRGNDHQIGVAQAVLWRIENQRAPVEL